MPSRKAKLFAGIALDENVRERMAQIAHRLEARGMRGRLERADKLHITLAFLGWVPVDRIEELQSCMQRCAARHSSFKMQLDKVGAFPHERRPRVVWVGARRQPRAFAALQDDLRDEYAQLGFSFKPEHVAHVTICRIKEPGPIPVVADFPPIDMHVRALTLFESIPEKTTTRYEAGFATPLRAN